MSDLHGAPDPDRIAPPSPRGPTEPAPRRRSRKGLIFLLALGLLPVAMCAPLCVIGMSETVPPGTVLELDLEEPLDEAAAGGLGFLAGDARRLEDLVLALEKAKGDPNVVGLVARVGARFSGLATAQEIRDAVLAFRAAGKPAIAYAETFGEIAPGLTGYFVASAFDEIWLQPSGDVGLVLPAAEALFLRGSLEKLGVEPRFGTRKEYKNAPNTFTERTFTAEHKEQLTRLFESDVEQITTAVAASRPGLGDAAAVRALLRDGPFGAKEALDRKMVDKLGYKEDVMVALATRLGLEPDQVVASADGERGDAAPRRLWVHRYAERSGVAFEDEGEAPVIAVIRAIGPVTRGRSKFDPLSGDRSFGSDTIAAAIRAAAADDDVQAIVLRVDSPGGSYVASDTIWRAVGEAKARGKKVVASMGDVAASGGYFVAMGADRIVASPGTITGSIGVYAGKFVVRGLLDKLGANLEPIVLEGGDPSLWSAVLDYSPEARRKLDATLDRIYADFVTKAAEGRQLSFDTLEPLARGRIWTGADAKARGLVDELGGFVRALEVARELVGLAKDAPIRVRPYPRERTPLQEILEAFQRRGENSDDVEAYAARPHAPVVVRAAAAAKQLFDAADAQVLEAPRVPAAF